MKTLTLAALFAAFPAFAADHAEAPGTQADPAADIADLYAWHSDSGTVTFVLTFAGLTPAGGDATYDPDAIYQIHIDNNADNMPDHTISFRFGQSDDGAWGVQASNVPGAAAPIEGPVGETIVSGDQRIYAGLKDDPFFFDLAGFMQTMSTGTVAFDSTRDSLAGTNVTSVVVEFNTSDVDGGGDLLDVWATSGRI